MAEVSLTGAQMLLVLEAVAEHGPVSAAEMARICDMNRTVAHRLLVTLAQRSYVKRGDKGYSLGPTVMRLAQLGQQHIRTVVKPIIVDLAERYGETVVVHGVSDLEAVVVDQAIAHKHLVRVEHRPGSRHPIHVGASGWALLAAQPERVISKALARLDNPEAARLRVAEIQKAGYAVSHDELQEGVHGVAVPVIDVDGSCEITLAILVPVTRAKSLLTFVEPLKSAARAVIDNMNANNLGLEPDNGMGDKPNRTRRQSGSTFSSAG
ncbi:IclR family transcriptional regulator [Methylopila sp. M107]|uniref:IclR family transcriptional regulator n=1 Tax=Methylopila sp. M107 TaxID=1101190 RepID=UPI00037DB1EC|nr:IclR family transcriptional regulator [Methylopila sp. M107]